MRFGLITGGFVSNKGLAKLMRKEGRLDTGQYINEDGIRCALGVVEDYHRDVDAEHVVHFHVGASLTGPAMTYLNKAFNEKYGCGIAGANDMFIGTREARAEHMAKLFGGLDNPDFRPQLVIRELPESKPDTDDDDSGRGVLVAA